MKVRIHGAEHPLKAIFSDEFVFEIPSYQRPYSWTNEHAGELLDDLLSALEESVGGEMAPYFLGSIVLAKDENTPEAKVIDGQQRLTTLTILLSVLAELSDGKPREQLRDFILQEGNDFKQTKTVYRLRLRARDAEFFQKYVQEAGGVGRLVHLDKGQLSDPAKNIQANAALFLERLEGLTSEERARLAKYLLNDCFMVAVSTPDTESAFRIFAVLNDRGLDLSHADIIKSELVGQISDHEQALYTDVWEAAEESLGVEAFADLFSHIRMIYAKSKQRGSLIKEFRSQVFPQIGDPRTFIKEVVQPNAEVYARMRALSWESTRHASQINQTLGWLNRIDNSDWVPAALRFLTVNASNPELIVRFLAKLERLASSMFIRRANINARIERYGLLLCQIEAASGNVDLPALEISEREKQDTVSQLRGELYLERRIRGYVLLRLDEELSAGGATYNHKLTTVEHVLPQSPPSASQWMKWFTSDEHLNWVHRLANLVLLPRARNSAAQNLDFEPKKAKYFMSAGGTSPFALTTQVLNTPIWTPDVLEKRQLALIEKLRKLWDL